jgi:uncharacterized protein (TIGR02996 family)
MRPFPIRLRADASVTDHAFLQAICDDPADDTPRLVYADWLEERGNPERAEFIRLQIDVAHGRRRAAAREKELLFQYGDAWTAELPELEGIRWGDFERGFVESVWAMTSQVFVDHAADIFTATPVRRLVVKRLAGRSPGLTHFYKCRFLKRLTHLDLSGQGRVPGMRSRHVLGLSWQLPNLRSFRASDCGLRDADMLWLCGDRDDMNRLEELVLSSNEIGSEGVRNLAESRHLTQLARLVLSHNQIDTEGARALARTANLPKLRALYLNSNPIDALGRRLLRQRYGASVCRF